ncbi:hypothetical protein JKF63_04019 [Porcisia hertigi]|uniref:J domain-containing protein n=1 Tax=Porcisia hertigi TaxID=2761500 RepID=A0A836L5C9_9TRYP|nr:hypothetical protein JKF63_04019 [Porcisia hertigi]
MLRFSRRFLGAAGIGPFDPYKILGVNPDASKEEIKKAYHRLALRFHPDSGAEGNSARFAAVNEAYEAVKDGKWRQSVQEQQKSAEKSGGGGWDPKMRMYVYEQPGSTTDGYVSGDTEKYLRFFMIGCFLFIFIRVALLWFWPAKKYPRLQQSGPDRSGSDGSVFLSSVGNEDMPSARPHGGDAGDYRSGSVHADREVEYRWSDNGASTPLKDPLSHR